MIYSKEENALKKRFNKYTLVLAVAECARMVTDEYTAKKNDVEKQVASRETDKTLSALMKDMIIDEKPVDIAVERITSGEYSVYDADGHEI